MELRYNGTGNVVIEGKEAVCHLYTNKEEGGVLFKLEVQSALASGLTFPRILEQLYVELSNGYRVILLNCTRVGGTSSKIPSGITTFTFNAKYHITDFGSGEEFENKFDSIYFYTLGLLDWGGIYAYGIDKEYKVFDEKKEDISIYEDEEILVSYGVSGSFLPVHESELARDIIELKQESYFKIEFKKATELNNFFDVFKKIKRLAEFTALKTIHPNRIEAYSNSNFDIIDEHKFIRKINVLSSEVNKTIPSSYDGIERLVTIHLEELARNDSFNKYMSRYDLFEPIIELYLEMLYNKDISNVRLFLSIIEALETYHSRFKANTINDFNVRLQTLLGKMTESNKKYYEDFLLGESNNKKQRFIYLKNRLDDLLLADNKVSFDIGDIERMEFSDVISSTRNYYIHYDESIKTRARILSEEEISIYNRTLLVILEFHLYTEIGFINEQDLLRKLYQRWERASSILDIERAFTHKYGEQKNS